jgi:hypothetical protein
MPLRGDTAKLALDTDLQAVRGPENQRRAGQGQDSQQRQRPQPGDQSEQQDAKRDIEDATGKTHTHRQTRAAVLP